MSAVASDAPIGLIDSGIGGLSIWRAIRRLLPAERMAYIADQAFFPYGDKDPDDLCARTEALSRVLLDRGCKLVVLACNTASVQTLAHVRTVFAGVPFVGVVPVIKTLARTTHTGKIALLCTTSTAHSQYTRMLAESFAPDKEMLLVDCKGLEALVEAGELRGPLLDSHLTRVLQPVVLAGADVIGLSCTHYPLVRGAIKRALGPEVRVFEPSRPVARRVRQLLTQSDELASTRGGPDWFGTTGAVEPYRALVKRIVVADQAAFESIEAQTPSAAPSPRC
jgi:glutamate racemase